MYSALVVDLYIDMYTGLEEYLYPALEVDMYPTIEIDMYPALEVDLYPALEVDLSPEVEFDLYPGYTSSLCSSISVSMCFIACRYTCTLQRATYLRRPDLYYIHLAVWWILATHHQDVTITITVKLSPLKCTHHIYIPSQVTFLPS